MIEHLLTKSKDVDSGFLPPKIGYIMDEVLIPMFDVTPPTSLLLDLLVKISQISTFKRTTVEYFETTTPINIYALIFLRSGEGKDKPVNWINKNLMQEYHEEFAKCLHDYIEKRKEEVQIEASDKYQKSSAQRERYIEEHTPRRLVKEFREATSEGFYALREAFSYVDFGGTFVRISEFGDFISSDNNANKEFISATVEVYDNGDNTAKIIKGERDYKEVEGVANSALLHTSLSGLLSGPNHNRLIQFLNRGMGRRAFICIPEIISAPPLSSYSERKAQMEEIQEATKQASALFKEFVSYQPFGNIYRFTEEANELLFDYRNINLKRAAKLGLHRDDAVIAEVKNRHWKTVKLAGLIASFEHVNDLTVTAEDLGFAIYISELFGNHFGTFFDTKEITPIDKLYLYFIEHSDKWVTKTEIRAQQFVGWNLFSKWVDDAINAVAELAMTNGKTLDIERSGSIGVKYMLTSSEQAKSNRLKHTFELIKEEVDNETNEAED